MGENNSAIRRAITAPSFEADQVHRSRIVDDLKHQLHRRLILIAAPAGYGKTTVLTDFTKHSDVPVTWVRLSEADQDPARSARLVWSSLSRRFRRLKKELAFDEHAGATPEAMAGLIGEALAARVPEDFGLVIDDVHLINGSEGALTFLSEMLDKSPPNMTALVAGREVPKIPLVRWIAQDELRSYGAEELALDLGELQAILSARLGREVEEGEALTLLEETGGWVTGVLLSDLLAGTELAAVQGADQPLTYEYLASSVFRHQDEGVRSFLLQSAALPVMTAAACDAALARDDSERMLTELLRRGLFVSVTGERPRTYEYHDLFRDFLLERPGQDEEQLREIRLRAADHFAEGDDPETAFGLYMAAGALQQARQVAELRARDLYEGGRDFTLRSWVDALLPEGTAGSKLLRLTAHLEGMQGRIGQSRFLYKRAREVARATDDHQALFKCWLSEAYILSEAGDLDGGGRALKNAKREASSLNRQADLELLAYEAQYEAVRLGKLESAVEKLEGILEMESLDPNRYSFRSYVLSVYGTYLATLGDLEGARVAFQEHLQMAESRDLNRRRPLSLNNLGNVAHFTGEYRRAYQLLDRSYRLSVELGHDRAAHIAQLTLGEMTSDLGMHDEALNYLKNATEIITRLENDLWMSFTFARLSMAYRRAGRLEKASQVWEMFEPEGGQVYWRGFAEMERAAASSLLHPAALEDSIGWMSEQGNPHVRAHCWSLLALAFLSADEHSKGVAYLSKALVEAEKTGLHQIVAGEAISYSVLRDALETVKEIHPRAAPEVLNRITKMQKFVAQRPSGRDRPKSESTKLTISLLSGKGQIRLGADQVITLRPLHREILYYLLDAESVRRDRLHEVFWPEMSHKQRVSNLHSAVHAIRDALGGELIITTTDGYAVGEEVRCDAHEFERAVKLALKAGPKSPEALQIMKEALDLFRGEYLSQMNSEWIVERRRILNELYMRLAERYAQVVDGSMDEPGPLEVLEGALKLDPYRESLLMCYLETLADAGRYHEVKIQAGRYRHRLAEELGLAPSEAFERRYRELIADRGAGHPLSQLAS